MRRTYTIHCVMDDDPTVGLFVNGIWTTARDLQREYGAEAVRAFIEALQEQIALVNDVVLP